MSDELFGESPDFVWSGPGTGVRCAACGGMTNPDEVEIEIEYGFENGARWKTYHLHLRCFYRAKRNRGDAN
jgi:hypothetical protein